MRSSKIELLLCFLSLLGAGTAYCQGEATEKFELVKKDGDIYIFERWIKFDKEDPPYEAREVKGEFKIRGSIEDGLALLKDERKIYEWQKHVSAFNVYPQSDSNWFEYSYHDIPWPVSDQDHLLEYKILDNQPGRKLYLVFTSIVNDSLASVNEDATRMYIFGSWYFEKRHDHVKVTYRIVSKPLGIPRIFTDPVIRSNMMSTIKAYIRLIDEINAKAK